MKEDLMENAKADIVKQLEKRLVAQMDERKKLIKELQATPNMLEEVLPNMIGFDLNHMTFVKWVRQRVGPHGDNNYLNFYGLLKATRLLDEEDRKFVPKEAFQEERDRTVWETWEWLCGCAYLKDDELNKLFLDHAIRAYLVQNFQLRLAMDQWRSNH